MKDELRQWILVKDVLPVELPIPALSAWHATYTDKLFYVGEESDLWTLSIEYMDVSDFVNEKIYGSHDTMKILLLEYQNTGDLQTNRRHLKDLERFIDDTGIAVELQMKITTPWGSCIVNPWEYSVIKSLDRHLEFIKSDLATIHFFNHKNTLNNKLQDKFVKLIKKDTIEISCILKEHFCDSFYIELNDELKDQYCKYHNEESYDDTMHKYKKFLLAVNTRNFLYNEYY